MVLPKVFCYCERRSLGVREGMNVSPGTLARGSEHRWREGVLRLLPRFCRDEALFPYHSLRSEASTLDTYQHLF